MSHANLWTFVPYYSIVIKLIVFFVTTVLLISQYSAISVSKRWCNFSECVVSMGKRPWRRIVIAMFAWLACDMAADISYRWFSFTTFPELAKDLVSVIGGVYIVLMTLVAICGMKCLSTQMAWIVIFGIIMAVTMVAQAGGNVGPILGLTPGDAVLNYVQQILVGLCISWHILLHRNR